MNLREFAALFPEFLAASWAAWLAILDRLSAPGVREFHCIAGRGSGKSRIAALIACAFAAREYNRAPGERIYVGIFAPDRKQAAITMRYVVGLLLSVPVLRALVVGEPSENAESIDLANGVTIEVLTASKAAPRGRSYALAIVEEAAFLPQDTSANPDVELIRALRPGLARVAGSLLAVVGSPYRRAGVQGEAARKYAGKPDGRVVYVQEPTLALNPSFDAEAVATAMEEDPAGAAAEYGAQFRRDIESYATPEAIDQCTVSDRLELAPRSGQRYTAFIDFAGGSGQDSATLAIAHSEQHGGQRVAVLDAVREVRPPFSPEQVCAGFAATLRLYGAARATADRYAADFAVEAMQRNGIKLAPAEKVKSDLYKELLPLLNSGRLELLDLPRLHAQLAGLERRTARGGKDSVDHAPGQHDDVANAAAGALTAVAREARKRSINWADPFGESEPVIATGAPRLFACGSLVSEHDVRECLRAQGDEVLESYERGALPVGEAYTRAQIWKRHSIEMRSFR